MIRKNNKGTISVIIPTYHRGTSVVQTVRSILRNSVLPTEILVVEQRGTGSVPVSLRQLKSDIPIRYFNIKRIGTSRAKNYGVRHAHGSVVAFTDDDCVVDRLWISRIRQVFSRHPDVGGIFGSVRPYHPENHVGQTCPCTFPARLNVVTRPCLHFKTIGYGNNMAWHRDVFNALGGCKSWLGPGSVGLNGEDGELVNRALLAGYAIRTEPTVVVLHNKWLKQEELIAQGRSYACGGMACYGYFAAQGFSFAQAVVTEELRTSIRELWRFFRSFCTEPRHLLEASCRIRGLLVGYFHALVDPVSVTGST